MNHHQGEGEVEMSKPLRALIVEDSEDDALLLVNELQRGDYAPIYERVETAEAMTAALKKQVWDIILSDYSMPHFSAPDSLRLLQQSGLDLPFIVISGTIGEDVAVATMQAGAHDYLIKGNLKRLVPAIERELVEAEIRWQRRQAQRELNERVKELSCLYSIAMITERPAITLDAVYQEVANVIPLGWQYPDITCARVTIDGKEFKTPNFRETAWKQASDIIVDGQRIGIVEVFYLEEKPEGDEGPFLKEERKLINGIARQLGNYIQRKRAEEAKGHLFLMLRTIRNVNQIIVKEKNRDKLLKSICDNFTKTRGCDAAWIALLDEYGRLITVAESGWGKDFLPMAHRLKQGELPDCGRRALSKSAIVLTEESSPTCTGCPLAKGGSNRGAMTARLEHNGKVYGLLSANLPPRFLTEPEECVLFEEVAGDIAFALHDMELEEARKQGEEALIDSETKYRSLTESLEELVYRADPVTFGVTYVNSSIVRLYGYTVEEWLKDRTLWESSIHPEDREGALAEITDAKRKVMSKVIQYRIIGKDKVVRWVEDHISWQKDESGNVASQNGLIYDITERKRAEEALSRSEERYRTILEKMGDSYFEVDLGGHITFANDSTCRNLRFSREELIGKSYKAFTVEKDFDTVYKAFTQAYRAGKPVKNLSWEVVRGDGTIGFGETNVVLLRNDAGQIIGFSGIGRDITEHKRAEEALRESEEKYRQLVENATEAIMVAQDGMIKFANTKAVEMTGYSIEELCSMPPAELIHPDDREMAIGFHYVRVTGDEIPRYSVFRLIDKEGNIKWTERSAGNITWEGKPALLIFDADVTERKLAEAKMFEYEELNRLKGNLLSTVSHELRTPLSTIKGYSTMLIDYDRRLKREEKHDYLEAIDKATDRLTELVDHLLDMSRLDAGLLRLDKTSTDVTTLLRTAVAEARLRMPGYNIVLNLPEAVLSANADGRRIRQVVDNLIDNAIKYSEEGTTVTVEARKQNSEMVFSVTDQGMGIPREEHDKVFDRMYRLEQRLAHDPGGMGLGLALCKALVEVHSGRIWVESKVGKGSKFSFTLPL